MAERVEASNDQPIAFADESNDQPIAFADEWNRGNPLRRCVARSSRTGKRCRRWAIKGGTVCPTHGGSTVSVKRKARERIERAAEQMARELLGIATSAESEAVRLAAVRDALDRAGLNPKTAVEVDVGPTPAFQQLITGIDRSIRRDGTRAPQPPAPALPAPEIVDAELVPDPAESGAERPRTPTAPGSAGDGPNRPPPWQGEPLPNYTPRPPGNQLMTLEEANASLSRERRRGRR
ncbi:hypothetical protein [Mycolicibacterium holsaticum]|uniref:hypothetical protein n=1 Tax=Mycolicibacterium holsaticum TaxID=152142 RepID=UPI001C7DE4C9|nr:hypothetical protein [Mycolicibacterium holsaticum]MDA4105706.1 hypothetical protein [Mycolicibacterium holsaticum DSM 44478 = JCM 12374]QZA13923.1 hypothetical protein K3U96_07300 [Mycolicibacterium holsaticum DSM 44478 = JCM 12374]UNC08617.1 hypothetical protein H5U41_19530 [Mycolicibacterium holsaticum DSM 44478 = JCM 12374]